MAIGLYRLSAAACVACLIAIPAYAQEPSSPAPAPAPANLAFVDGVVDVVQDGVTERADPPLMLIDGDMVRTRNGRAEIVFGDGTLLHLSHDTDLEVLAEEHLRLRSGRAIVRISHGAARPYVIDTPASSVRLDAEGEYAITADRTARLEVAVTRGTAHIGDASTWTVIGGQRITLAGPDARPLIEPFNTARGDAFAQWTADRTHGAASSSSAAQLPYQLRPYAPTLDHYGRWDYLAPHGYVWIPSVGAGWRPYYDGSWSFTRYGWTWRGHERWAWPTHHYGRWGFTGAVWYWVPAALWAPAWVSWSVAPGYVGWAPLGWHHSVGLSTWSRRDSRAYTPNYNPWRGWTVVHRDHFAPRHHVRTHAIGSDRLDEITRQRLSEADAVTRRQPRALPRESVVTVPGARGDVRRPTTVRPIDASAPRSDPNPAYTPAPSRGSDDRRGTIREPRRSETTPPREGAAEAPAPSSPRVAPSGEASGGARATEGRGAVRRGEAARTPSRGESPPAAKTATPTPKPSTQGGARRRSGG
jgi:FecR protein